MNAGLKKKFRAFLCTVVIILTSCSKSGSLKVTGLEEYYNNRQSIPVPADSDFVVTGRMKIESVDARLRGAVRLVVSGGGELRMDFRHSSLMGAYEEDFSLLITPRIFYIYDRKRDRLYEGKSALNLINERLSFSVEPDDILYLLLFKRMEEGDIGSPRYMTDGSRWVLDAVFRGRHIQVGGDRIGEVGFFKQCFGRRCYTARYGDYRKLIWGSYPFYLNFSDDRNDIRVTLEVKKVSLVEHDPREFDVKGMLFSDIYAPYEKVRRYVRKKDYIFFHFLRVDHSPAPIGALF